MSDAKKEPPAPLGGLTEGEVEIPRYRLYLGERCRMERDSSGDAPWVRYDDHIAALRRLTAPTASGLTEDALVEWACKEMHGTWDFPEAHSDGGKATLRDRMRRIIERARLTAPRAEGVDAAMVETVARALATGENHLTPDSMVYNFNNEREPFWKSWIEPARRVCAALTAAAPKVEGVDEAMVERACEVMWPSWKNPRLRSDEARRQMHAILEAALTAAAPKVEENDNGR